jgi:hypothetical protein
LPLGLRGGGRDGASLGFLHQLGFSNGRLGRCRHGQ